MEGWSALKEPPPPTEEEMAEAEEQALAIDKEECEAHRATFANEAGKRTLELLHTRYIDTERCDIGHPAAERMMFFYEGCAHVVRELERQSKRERDK